MKAELAYPTEVIKIWFSYLRLAHEVGKTDPNIKLALKRSARFYRPWGDVTKVSFKQWWKDHSNLFEENDVIQLIRYPDLVPLPRKDRLLLSIPLTRSPTELATMVLAIFKKNARIVSSKSKKRPTSRYTLTEGAEIKSKGAVPLEDKLAVYRIALEPPKASRSELLLRVLGDPRLSSLSAFRHGSEDSKKRSLRRYLKDAEQVMINVANGQFPGPRGKGTGPIEA